MIVLGRSCGTPRSRLQRNPRNAPRLAPHAVGHEPRCAHRQPCEGEHGTGFSTGRLGPSKRGVRQNGFGTRCSEHAMAAIDVFVSYPLPSFELLRNTKQQHSLSIVWKPCSFSISDKLRPLLNTEMLVGGPKQLGVVFGNLLFIYGFIAHHHMPFFQSVLAWTKLRSTGSNDSTTGCPTDLGTLKFNDSPSVRSIPFSDRSRGVLFQRGTEGVERYVPKTGV